MNEQLIKISAPKSKLSLQKVEETLWGGEGGIHLLPPLYVRRISTAQVSTVFINQQISSNHCYEKSFAHL